VVLGVERSKVKVRVRVRVQQYCVSSNSMSAFQFHSRLRFLLECIMYAWTLSVGYRNWSARLYNSSVPASGIHDGHAGRGLRGARPPPPPPELRVGSRRTRRPANCR